MRCDGRTDNVLLPGLHIKLVDSPRGRASSLIPRDFLSEQTMVLNIQKAFFGRF
jgi:hypothetical protein